MRLSRFEDSPADGQGGFDGSIHTELRRSSDDRFLFGVAGGFAEFFNVDPFLIRVGWVLLTMATAGIGALMYVVLASIIPISSRDAVRETKGPRGVESDHSGGAKPESAIRIRLNIVRGVIGTAIIAIGMIILLEQLGVMGAIRWDIVFPSTIIVLGVTVLVPSIVGLSGKRKADSINGSPAAESENGEGPDLNEGPPKRHVARNVVGIGMIVVGVTSLLTELHVIESIRWDILWPAAFVVVGLLVLLPLVLPNRR